MPVFSCGRSLFNIDWRMHGGGGKREMSSVGIINKLMGGPRKFFTGPPLGGPKFLQILYNANDGFHRLF